MDKRRGLSLVVILGVIVLGFAYSINNYLQNSKMADMNVPNGNTRSYSHEKESEKYNGKTIYLDPGHGDYDPGTIGIDDTEEKGIVLSLALKMGELLEEKGYRVEYSRTNDEVPAFSTEQENLEWRVNDANSKDVDLFLSIHVNTFDDSSVKGLEVWYENGSEESENLGELLHRNLNNLNYTSDRGLRSTSENNLYVLGATEAPATLIEFGFISNEDDYKNILSEDIQNKIAETVVNGIDEYFNPVIDENTSDDITE